MRFLLFGQIREAAPHLHNAEMTVGARTLDEVLDWIDQNESDLGAALKRGGVRYAIDQHFADGPTKLHADSEVALMSPLSGG